MLPAVQFAKPPAQVLWDTSIVIFALQNTGKRARLGNNAMLPKDTYKKFILTINVCYNFYLQSHWLLVLIFMYRFREIDVYMYNAYNIYCVNLWFFFEVLATNLDIAIKGLRLCLWELRYSLSVLLQYLNL